MKSPKTPREETAREIDDAALGWAVRIDEQGLDPAADPEVSAWLAQDPRRAGALLRAQAALSLMDRGRALAGADGPPLGLARTRRTRRGLLAGAAAGLVGVSAAGVLFAHRQTYRTALGEIRSVPLQDGSLISINSRTALDVAMQSRARRVALEDGEAWFEVAKDPTRPFIVEAGAVRVRAVGTAFSVRKLAAGVDVMVTEGVVETWRAGEEGERTRISAGSRALVTAAAPPIAVAAPSEIERSLAWRNGQIVLDGESLADAAREFNRYNQRQIVIEDPALAATRFVGLFRTNEPETFAAAVAAASGAEVKEDSETIRLHRVS